MNLTARAPLPVTLLSGFLGAGKTTVLNQLLTNTQGIRFAVVENEFGAVNIDSQLISGNSEGIIELSNGCICCTVNADLVRGLENLAMRRERGELNFDWIIIETTGLADPGAVAQTFFAAPELRDRFMLDGIVVVVDALHGQKQLDQHPVVQRQTGFADRLLLAKCDLVDADAIAELSVRLRKINPRAPQQQLKLGCAHAGTLIGIGGFNLDTSLLAPKSRRPRAGAFKPSENGQGKTTRWSARAVHNDEITSFLLEAGEVDLESVGAFVQSMIDEFGDALLRYKGILAIPNEQRKLIFQGVQRVAGFDFGVPWKAKEERRSRIVVIGKKLPEKRLRAAFLNTASGTGERKSPDRTPADQRRAG